MQYSLLVLALFCGVFVPTFGANETTTAPSPTGTGINSTTAETTQPDTTHTMTTLMTPTTTAPSMPDEAKNNYTYYDNKTVCLKAVFSAHFQRGKVVWNVSKDAHIDNDTSDCGTLTVKFGNNNFSIIFNHTEKNFYISEVNAHLGDLATNAPHLTKAKAANGSSYLCKSGITISMSQNVTLYMKDVQIQAYYVKDGEFATAQKCDSDLSALVPIIVGAVLAGLIIIVVVAYFIGRRRNRTGYEEI